MSDLRRRIERLEGRGGSTPALEAMHSHYQAIAEAGRRNPEGYERVLDAESDLARAIERFKRANQPGHDIDAVALAADLAVADAIDAVAEAEHELLHEL